ncbi:hypothetical protein KCP75_12035 [Salmonella enterica subsp. enterica]|nr:hypothetical protein KCP75_12035 [Salmonella enterica subsp. enterica]
MVLFAFVVMMLNLGGSEIEQERQWLKPQVWIVRRFCLPLRWRSLCTLSLGVNDRGIDGTPIARKGGHYAVRPYVLAVELASMLLLLLAGSVGGVPRRS